MYGIKNSEGKWLKRIDRKGQLIWAGENEAIDWKLDSTAHRKFNKLMDEGKLDSSCIVDFIGGLDDGEELVMVRDDDYEPIDTEHLFKELNEKCLKCQGECKQSSKAIIVKCPDFKKVA